MGSILMFFWLIPAFLGLVVFAVVILLAIRIRRIMGSDARIQKDLTEMIPYDPDKQEAVVKASICTGEQAAGFLNRKDGRFTEVMLIRSEQDLDTFMKIYNLTEIRKIY